MAIDTTTQHNNNHASIVWWRVLIVPLWFIGRLVLAILALPFLVLAVLVCGLCWMFWDDFGDDIKRICVRQKETP